jgi:hypothetical protein
MALHARTHPTLDVEGCYGCQLASVAIGFHMCPGGKAEWHGATINERRERMIAEAKKKGSTIEPKHSSAGAWAPTRV